MYVLTDGAQCGYLTEQIVTRMHTTRRAMEWDRNLAHWETENKRNELTEYEGYWYYNDAHKTHRTYGTENTIIKYACTDF